MQPFCSDRIPAHGLWMAPWLPVEPSDLTSFVYLSGEVTQQVYWYILPIYHN